MHWCRLSFERPFSFKLLSKYSGGFSPYPTLIKKNVRTEPRHSLLKPGTTAKKEEGSHFLGIQIDSSTPTKPYYAFYQVILNDRLSSLDLPQNIRGSEIVLDRDRGSKHSLPYGCHGKKSKWSYFKLETLSIV